MPSTKVPTVITISHFPDTIINIPSSTRPYHLLVSSQTLSSVSPVFTKLLDPNNGFAPLLRLPSPGRPSITLPVITIPKTQYISRTSIILFIKILDSDGEQPHSFDQKADVSDILGVALLADEYICREVVRPQIDNWVRLALDGTITALEKPGMSPDFVRWLAIARLFPSRWIKPILERVVTALLFYYVKRGDGEKIWVSLERRVQAPIEIDLSLVPNAKGLIDSLDSFLVNELEYWARLLSISPPAQQIDLHCSDSACATLRYSTTVASLAVQNISSLVTIANIHREKQENESRRSIRSYPRQISLLNVLHAVPRMNCQTLCVNSQAGGMACYSSTLIPGGVGVEVMLNMRYAMKVRIRNCRESLQAQVLYCLNTIIPDWSFQYPDQYPRRYRRSFQTQPRGNGDRWSAPEFHRAEEEHDGQLDAARYSLDRSETNEKLVLDGGRTLVGVLNEVEDGNNLSGREKML